MALEVAMITYELQCLKNAGTFKYLCTQFPELKTEANDRQAAMRKMISLIHKELQKRIKKNLEVPLGEASIRPATKKVQYVTLPVAVELKVKLYGLLKFKGVSRTELAKLLALRDTDILMTDWILDKIRKKAVACTPHYKKVQRLFDLNYKSSLDDLSEAFRLIDCMIDVQLFDKHTGAKIRKQ
jgi:hypothetical protein